MKRYVILLVSACFFGLLFAAYGADVSDELEPEAIEARIREHRMGELLVKATPAAEAYRNLIFKEWWTDSKVKADANGQCRIRAFYGKYAVTCGAQTKEVLLSKEKGQVAVSFE